MRAGMLENDGEPGRVALARHSGGVSKLDEQRFLCRRRFQCLSQTPISRSTRAHVVSVADAACLPTAPHVCRRRARVCSMPLWEESSPQLYWPQSAGEFFLCVRRAAAIGWSEQHGSCGSVAGMLANWTFTETAIPPRGCTASCYVFRSMTPPACAALPTFSLQ